MKPFKSTVQRTLACMLLLFSSLLSAETGYSNEKLQQLLAPIALYPDTVLTHILIASTYPLEVVQADRWAKQHQGLTADEAVNRAENEPWDPSVKALLAFPSLLDRLSEDLLWSQELGEAFLADEEGTLNAVQALRQQAWDNGSLQDMEHQKVVRVKEQIVIQPLRREVVYIPYYDTLTVYGSWRWQAYPPVYWAHPPRYRSGFYWGFSAPVGDWFYSSGFYWPNRTVVINLNRPYYYGTHRRYGYHQDYTQHWRHDHNHRRNVRYHQPRHNTQATPQRSRNISDRQREQVTRQLRSHPSRVNNSGATRVSPTAQPRSQPDGTRRQPVTRSDNRPSSTTPVERAAPDVQRQAPSNSNSAPRTMRTAPTAPTVQPRQRRAPSSNVAPRTSERRAMPRTSSGSTRAAPQRRAPSSDNHRSRIRN